MTARASRTKARANEAEVLPPAVVLPPEESEVVVLRLDCRLRAMTLRGAGFAASCTTGCGGERRLSRKRGLALRCRRPRA